MFNIKMAGLIVLLAVSFMACKKDRVENDADVKLAVNLQNHLIEVSDIDSANVVLRKGVAGTPYFFRFQKGTTSLEALIDGLPAGQYTVDFDLYTKEMPSGKKYQFVTTRQVTIRAGMGTINIEGPDDLGPDDWSARKVTTTTGNAVVVIIPLDVNDPYFEIRTNGTYWNLFGVERTALQGSAVVAHKTWDCQNNCLPNSRIIYDRTQFAPFTETIKNASWTKNEIIITVGNLQSQEYHEFGHVWQK